jgi:hypothetical protein
MLCNDGRVIDPDHTPQERARGPGVKTFDEFDHCVLIFLYLEEFSRSNASYVENLLLITGTKTSTSTIYHDGLKTFFQSAETLESQILSQLTNSSQRTCGKLMSIWQHLPSSVQKNYALEMRNLSKGVKFTVVQLDGMF